MVKRGAVRRARVAGSMGVLLMAMLVACSPTPPPTDPLSAPPLQAPAPAPQEASAEVTRAPNPPEAQPPTPQPGAGPELEITRDDAVALAADLTTALQESSTRADWTAFFGGDQAAIETSGNWWESVQAVPMDVREIRLHQMVGRATDDGRPVQLSFRHQITGADTNPVRQVYEATLRRDADGAIQIVDFEPQEENPWDWEGVLQVRTSEDAVVLVHHEYGWAADELAASVQESVAHVTGELGSGRSRAFVAGLARDEDMELGEGIVYLDGVASEKSSLWSADGLIGLRVLIDLETVLDEIAYLGPDRPLPTPSWYAVQHLVEHELQWNLGVPWGARGLSWWYDDQAWQPDLTSVDVMGYYLDEAGERPQELPPTDQVSYFDDWDVVWQYDLVALLVMHHVEEGWGDQVARDFMWDLATSQPGRGTFDRIAEAHLDRSWEDFEAEFLSWAAEVESEVESWR